MPFTYTNDDLITSIKRRASIPTSQSLFTDEDLMSFADEELQTVIFPMIMSTKGDYFVSNNDTTMTSATSYDIPSDAVGLKIKDCYFLNANGDQRQLTQVNLSDVTNQYFRLDSGFAYYIEGNKVHLYPDSKTGDTLRIKYYKRASMMVPNDKGAKFTNADTANLVFDSVPTSWAVGDRLTLTSATPGFSTLSTSFEILTITLPNIMTLVEDDDDTPIFTAAELVDNWLTQNGDTVIAQITPEAHPILAQAVAVKCLEALGDPGLMTAQAKFQQISDAFIESMTPRADGQAKKIVNRTGHLAWNKFGRIGWY